MTQSSRTRPAIAVLAVAGLALSLTVAGPVPATAAGPSSPQPAPREAQHVTLVTGDRVTSFDGTTSIEPGPGRRTIDFDTYTTRGRVHVVPSDVRDELASGRLDQRLFDITGLVEAKYDDASTRAIPVIVTYKAQAKQRAALPAAQLVRELPVINGAAWKIEKDRAGDFLRGLGTARSAPAIDKVWLDSKRTPKLDRSVPQIGAPAAWQAGYTGQGIKVAVLDTGVDKTHPDLATQVVGSKNFTSESAADVIGHGTHVASTIAGTGAASDGKYRGVAPDAELYDAKVCGVDGCPDSMILAGMEWAVTEVGADVVNLSIGGPDQPGIDPLEAAVNRLTAQHGTLFVIAAGNEGWSGDKMVNSPGSADDALTVGAVNKDDSLADFSSRGPRAGDSAVKPDVTAPGGEIVAARSKDAVAEEPVGDKYQTLSGTSMATPHTAGAAALLAQQHPAWQAAELKNALIGSAKPSPDNTVSEQGAGRIDVAKAVGQSVVAEEGNLSFGVAQWPHSDDKPVVRTLTYRNYGDKPVELDLAASMKTPEGDPAPGGAFTLSANTVTVPAGGTAAVQVTSDTKHDGPDVFYSGRITATAPGVSVTTAAGVDKEDERYTLNITAIGPDGAAIAPTGLLSAWNGYDAPRFGNGVDKVISLRLPKDTWSLGSTLRVPGAGKPAIYHLVQPEIALAGEVSVVLDTRLAKPLRITVPEEGAEVREAYFGFNLMAPDGYPEGWQSKFYDFDNRYSAQIGPPVAPERKLKAFLGSLWAKPTTNGTFDNSPYVYGQANGFHGQYPTGFVRDVQPKELAVVHQQVFSPSERRIGREIIGGLADITAFGLVELKYDRPMPTKLLADSGAARWYSVYAELGAQNETISFARRVDARYQAGQTYHERYLAPVHTVTAHTTERSPDGLSIYLRTLLDGEGNDGRADATDTAWSKLLLDGEVIAEADRFGSVQAENLPAGKAKYTLQTSMTRPSYSPVSTRTDLTWTFASAAVTKTTALPFISIRYRPALGDDFLAERRPVTVLPIHLGSQLDPIDGVRPSLPGVKEVSLKVSGDGGKTWQSAVVTKTGTGRYQAVYPTPKNTNSISLRTHVVDVDGNTTDLTTVDAYRIR
ncbi:S8 family serine peptidase [Kribbella albertanoniae]|uniref:S8 family serine peptidase n=1 Tax=Kribbella albertanoniae TaxID=1266829 RepID=UPI001EE0B0E4|nr:S8 family serine peptidase [Kribbella albertanoniae]